MSYGVTSMQESSRDFSTVNKEFVEMILKSDFVLLNGGYCTRERVVLVWKSEVDGKGDEIEP
jgi:hypothetical protein